jgi:hypothetical protein
MAAKFKDANENPLTEQERAQISRMTSDPLSFNDAFIHWLNEKYIDEFPLPPHGAQLEMEESWLHPGTGWEVVAWGVTNHDTNAYIVGDTFRVPGITQVKLSGVYVISVDFEYAVKGTDAAAGIHVNDVPIAIQYQQAVGSVVSLCVVRRLNESDIVDVRSTQSAGAQEIDFEGIVPPTFNIALIYKLDNGDSQEGGDDCNPPLIETLPVASGFTDYGDGNTVTVTDGTWTGDATITFTYQWQHSDTGELPWDDIPGQTTNSIDYDMFAEVTEFLRCKVTATNDCGSSNAVSNMLGISGQ